MKLKLVGALFVLCGVLVILFIIASFFDSQEQNLSPIQENDGVKIIYLSPTP